jgi:ankyrin repeat protein
MSDSEILKVLLKTPNAIHYANASIWNDQTPIFTSVYLSDLECVRLLLVAGSDPNHKTLEGESLLDYASTFGASKEIWELLLQFGASPDTASSDSNRRMAEVLKMPLVVASSDHVEQSKKQDESERAQETPSQQKTAM